MRRKKTRTIISKFYRKFNCVKEKKKTVSGISSKFLGLA